MKKQRLIIVVATCACFVFPALVYSLDVLKPTSKINTGIQTKVPGILQRAAINPLYPMPIEPVNTTVPLGTGVVCSWQAFPNATGYIIKVCSNADMSTVIRYESTTNLYYTIPSNYLKAGNTYYWQIAALKATTTEKVFGPTPPASFTVTNYTALSSCDLVISNFSFTPSKVYEGDFVYFSLKVKNIGTGPGTFPANKNVATMSSSSPYYYLPASFGLNDYIFNPGDEIEFGGSTIEIATDLKRRGFKTGTFTFTTIADPDNYIGETNESNNSVVTQLTILPQPNRGDLVISNIALDTPNPTSTAPFAFNVTIKNQGLYKVNIYHGIKILSADPYALYSPQTYGISTLQPGATMTYTVKPNTAGMLKGTRTWTFIIDPENLLIESDKSNNQKSFTFTVN